jgi:hypothetical protein
LMIGPAVTVRYACCGRYAASSGDDLPAS